ncbi:MAG: hypothetical protein ABFD08_09310 [Syntrophomonas sp.]
MDGTKTILKVMGVIIGIGIIGVFIGEGIRLFKTRIMKDKNTSK